MHCKTCARSDWTPVVHCKIASEDTKFNWGFTKTIYRTKLLEDKRNKDKFHMLVESVFNSDTLTMQVTRVNARQARKNAQASTPPLKQTTTTSNKRKTKNTK